MKIHILLCHEFEIIPKFALYYAVTWVLVYRFCFNEVCNFYVLFIFIGIHHI